MGYLIDWNLLDKFNPIIPNLLQFLLIDKFKTSAMDIVYSFIHKGMDDPLKIELVYKL